MEIDEAVIEEQETETESEQVDEPQDETQKDNVTEGQEQAQAQDEAPGKLVVTIGEPKETDERDEVTEEREDDTPVIKKIRTAYRNKEKEIRDTRRELAELRAKLNAQAPQPVVDQVPPEPTLDDDDVLYDTDKFKKKVFEWTEKKRKYDEAAAAREAEARADSERWATKLSAYKTARADKRFDDYEDAEFLASNLLNTMQQSIIIQECKDPTLVVYALGKNEAEAKRLADIKNPVRFAMEVARLEEKDIKVSKKPSVQPERRVTGGPGSGESSLERVREKVMKSGGIIDISSSLELRRAQRSKK